ncbi:MAG: ankyrin repeat domain-containing protein [Elusimicrobiaceae bacterium]|nr:ankyrin repeat domain-containing protein [Elusimicrobiaceae bacterium]
MKKLLIFLCVCNLLLACNKKDEQATKPEQPVNETKVEENTTNHHSQNIKENDSENIADDNAEETSNTEYKSLGEAAAYGDIKQVEKLLDAGVDVNYMQPNDGTGWYCGEDYCEDSDEQVEQYFQYDRDNGTPLMRAAYNGHLKVVKLLIDKGADINIQNEAGSTALMKAAYKGYFEIVKLLIDKGAKINLKERHGATALIKGVAQGYTEIVKLLLDKGADVNVADAYNCEDNICFHEPEGTALESAVFHDRIEIVKLLLNKGADVNFHLDFKQPSCWWCETVLTRAVYTGNPEIVKLLIDKGANVNEQNSEEKTPLYIADNNDYTEIAELLKAAGAKE